MIIKTCRKCSSHGATKLSIVHNLAGGPRVADLFYFFILFFFLFRCIFLFYPPFFHSSIEKKNGLCVRIFFFSLKEYLLSVQWYFQYYVVVVVYYCILYCDHGLCCFHTNLIMFKHFKKLLFESNQCVYGCFYMCITAVYETLGHSFLNEIYEGVFLCEKKYLFLLHCKRCIM